MSASTIRASLFALLLFCIAGFLSYRHFTEPIDPDNGNLILDKNANVSGASAEIAKMGEAGPAATPEDVAKLVRYTKDSTPATRADAAMALGKIRSEDAEARKALTDALTDEDPAVRSAALIAFDDHSRAAKSADDPMRAQFETAVIASLQDKTARVRRLAITTLRARPEGSLTNIHEIAKAEIATLADEDPSTVIGAVSALRDLPRIAGPNLGEDTVRTLTAELPQLLTAISNGDERSRPEYQGLVRTITESAEKVKFTPSPEVEKAIRESLAANLANARVESRKAVLDVYPAVANMAGTEAERAELLRPLLKDEDAQVRSAAYRALWSLPMVAQPEGEVVKKELRDATKSWIDELGKSDGANRELAAWLLSWTDREDADAALAALKAQQETSDEAMKKRVTSSIESLEAAKSSESWPLASWKPFRTGRPPAMPGSNAPLSPPRN